MATFSITSTVAIDNVTIGSNSQTVDVESVLDYTKSIGNTYAKLTTNSQQPTAASQVFIHNTGDETAIVNQRTIHLRCTTSPRFLRGLDGMSIEERNGVIFGCCG